MSAKAVEVRTVNPPVTLAEALSPSARWWRCAAPFPHVLVDDVFSDRFLARLTAAARATLGRGSLGYLGQHDLSGLSFTQTEPWPFRFFVERPWHDLLADVLAIRSPTGEVHGGLHHHRPGGRAGSPHNDLNPGWFPPRRPDARSILVADPAFCDYRTGRARTATDRAVRSVRAGAAILYLDNDGWTPGDGGETGLFEGNTSELHRAIAPLCNRMLAFRCTPTSLHAFLGECRRPRNSIVMWLHRPYQDAVDQWGAAAIIDYAR